MSKIKRLLGELKQKYSRAYSIKTIDLERCLYFDFGNGYDVEISGANNRKRNHRLTIYLWKDKNRIVDKVENVYPTAEDIHSVVESLCREGGSQTLHSVAMERTEADREKNRDSNGEYAPDIRGREDE